MYTKRLQSPVRSDTIIVELFAGAYNYKTAQDGNYQFLGVCHQTARGLKSAKDQQLGDLQTVVISSIAETVMIKFQFNSKTFQTNLSTLSKSTNIVYAPRNP